MTCPAKTWTLFMNTYLANKPNLPMATKQMITGGQSTPATADEADDPDQVHLRRAEPTFSRVDRIHADAVDADTRTDLDADDADDAGDRHSHLPGVLNPCTPGGAPTSGP